MKLSSKNAYLAFVDKEGKEESILNKNTIPQILADISQLKKSMVAQEERANAQEEQLRYVKHKVDNWDKQFQTLTPSLSPSIVTPTEVPTRAPTNETLGSFLYAVGGIDGSGRSLRSVERYSASTNAWETVTSMSSSRIFPGVAVYTIKIN